MITMKAQILIPQGFQPNFLISTFLGARSEDNQYFRQLF